MEKLTKKRGTAKSQHLKKIKGLNLLKKDDLPQKKIAEQLGVSLAAVKKWSLELNHNEQIIDKLKEEDPKRGPKK